LRITFVTMNYAPSVGGMQLLVQRVAEGLAMRGHDVEVITTNALLNPGASNPGWVSPSTEVIGGVLVRRLPFARRTHRVLRFAHRFRRRLVRSLGLSQRAINLAGPLVARPISPRLWIATARALQKRDVVTGVSIPYSTLVAVGLVPRRRRAACVALPLHHDHPGVTYRRPTRMALRRFDAWIALSDFEVGVLADMGARREDIVNLPPGCDLDAYPQVEPSEARGAVGLPDRPTVGYVGRLTAYKGVDTLLAAVPGLLNRHPDITVLVAGASLGIDDLDRQIQQTAELAGDRLIVRRDFAIEDKPMLLAACDVVVCPSREESFGMVNVEAWAAGRPVISGDIPAVRCLVRPGENGYLSPVGDHEALAEWASSLLDDPAAASEMGRLSRRRAEEEFAWEAIVDRWQDLLADTARISRLPTPLAEP